MNEKINKLDLMPVKSLVDLFLHEEEKIINELKKQKTKITTALNKLIKRIQKGGRVIYFGAGTSGRLGVLDASECKPTFNTNKFLAIIAGGRNAIFNAEEGAEDNKKQAIKDLKKIRLNKKDVLVGIAASGETSYTVSGIKYARKMKALTIGISSNSKSTLSKISHLSISPDINEEIIQGSSRLKSGTAQKIILNMLSSISMIKTGRVFNNLMIDVNPKNKKLIKRAIGIISTICKVSFNKAKTLFQKAKKDTKAAIVMHFKNCNLKIANEILQKANYDLRKIIK